MATITKGPKLRQPGWHSGTDRWRLRVGMERNTSGKLVERTFYWVAPYNDGTPPNEVVAKAFLLQQDWHRIVSNWPSLRAQLAKTFVGVKADLPDYSQPVWYDAVKLGALLSIWKQAEKAVEVQIAEDRSKQIVEMAKERVADDPISQHDLVQWLLVAGVLPKSVAGSVPIERVTIEQAIDQFLGCERKRIGGDLKPGTFNAKRNALLICVGKTTNGSSLFDRGVEAG